MRSADDYYRRSIELYEQRKFAEAALWACRGLREYPDDGRLWQLHGTARWLLNDFHGACSALEAASCLMPLFAVAQCALAGSYVQIGKPDVALIIYRHLAEDDHLPPALLEQVASGLGMIQEYALGVKVCRRVAEREPANHRVLLGLAYYLSQLGRPAELIAEPLERAYRLAPEVLHYRLNLACVYARMGRPQEAHRLVAEIPPETIRCPFWIRKVMEIASLAGDHEMLRTYENRIAKLTPEFP